MRVSRRFALLAAAGLLCASQARADKAWRTNLTLAEPTQIPGDILPAGNYIVKVVNTQETRSIVQFTTPDEAVVVATVLAVPNYRVETPQNTEFVYFQRAEGMGPAIKSWVHPGYNYGVEFVYPKEKATVLAEKTHETVYTTESNQPTLQSEVRVMTPEKNEIVLEAYTPPPKELPKTGSSLPILAMLGAASLAGAFAIRSSGSENRESIRPAPGGSDPPGAVFLSFDSQV